MMRDDEVLLQSLSEALRPDDVEPTIDRVALLREQVATSKSTAELPPPRHNRVLVGVAAAAVVVVAFALGAVVGGNLPGPLRDAAHSVGLPVDSSELVGAYDELDKLGNALAVDDLDAAKVADEAMLDKVKSLDEDEKAEIVPVAHEVHQRYLEHLSEQFEP